MIEGVVADAFGQSLDDVAVRVLSTRLAATTDPHGRFSTDYPSGTFVLEFSKPGYTTEELELTIQSTAKFPVDSVVLFPVPSDPGIYYLDADKKALVKLPPEVVRRTSSRQITAYHTTATGAPYLPPGQATFIDNTSREIFPMRLSRGSGTIQVSRMRNLSPSLSVGTLNERASRVGREQLLVRVLTVEAGEFAWVEQVRTSSNFDRPDESPVSYPFRVDSVALAQPDDPYIAAMYSTLRNLVAAQQAYYADHAAYTDDLGESFQPATGVAITITDVTDRGWRATAQHDGFPLLRCSIAVGAATATYETEGEPSCSCIREC